jgi:site-specific recombinase XerD
MSEPLVRHPLVDWTQGGAMSLQEAQAAFFGWKRKVRAQSTRDEYQRVFDAFRAFLAEHPEAYSPADPPQVEPPLVAALRADVLICYADWLEGRGPLGQARFRGGHMAASTVSGYLRTLKTLCRFLVAMDVLPRDPFTKTVDLIPSVEEVPLRMASPEDVVRIAAVIRGESPVALRDRALVLLDYDTGQRTVELARLRLGHLGSVEPTLTLVNPKNHRDWVLDLNDRARAALEAYLERGRPALAAGHARRGRPDLGFVFLADPRPHGGRTPLPGGQFTENGLYQMLTRRWREAGGEGGFGFHRFRHGLGTAMAEAGATPLEIAARLNHKQTKSTQIYTHPSRGSVARIVERSAWAAFDAAEAKLACEGLAAVPPPAMDGECARERAAA